MKGIIKEGFDILTELAVLLAPVAGIVALFKDFSWTNFLLFLILLVGWKYIHDQI